MAEVVLFKDLPINSAFVWADRSVFIKTAEALDTGMSKQPSNCIRLSDRHKCTMTANHECIPVQQPSIRKFEDSIMGLETYEVWMEGFACTGQSAPHQFIGKIRAENFDFACYLTVLKWCISDNILTGVDNFNEYFNVQNNSFWGCKCYDNEPDSMYFG